MASRVCLIFDRSLRLPCKWVCCSVVYICGSLPGRIRYALANLPETLDETYQRTLREIKTAHWEFACHLLQCVTVASRPLRGEELAEVLAFDFETGPIPKFYGGWRLEDPVDAVLSTRSSLLAIVNVEDFPVIQFSHFSVRDFLTSRIVCLPRANRILRSASGYTTPLRNET